MGGIGRINVGDSFPHSFQVLGITWVVSKTRSVAIFRDPSSRISVATRLTAVLSSVARKVLGLCG